MTTSVLTSGSSEQSSQTSQDSALLWQKVQADLKGRMSQPSFETWISPLEIEKVTDKAVTLKAESEFNRELILKRYRDELKAAFSEAVGHAMEVAVVVIEPKEDEETATEEVLNAKELPNRPWTPRTTRSNLNPRYTFESFVVGQHNRFCHAAALAVAETPAQSYNPFFIYGGVGLGKTHLMQAIGHFALQHHTDLKVRYVTAEQFTNDMINALGQKDMKGFQDRYRRNDILIIDDVQFLEGKTRTQEEVFHTFNALHESGKQVILSSDRSPKNLSRLEDRLRSRFEWGLIADVQVPDLETRVAILQKKAERENFQVGMDVLNFIGESHPNNIRELEGALNKVAAYGMLTRTAIDLVVAQTVLGTPVDNRRVSLEDILETVAGYYHMRSVDLKSPSRAKDLSHARQVAIYVIREMTESSFPKIGELIGGRKHTTIMYAYEKIKDELESHPVLKQQIEEIRGRIKPR
ncbi:chromosomal replication initiator protein DnaA [Vampirovibrio sp.]|uniref:chromosomal replication initiator protein DnaA n=1 Tax=Vampirovibrio sp. TaxID=2717857 RepID=UPI003593F53D